MTDPNISLIVSIAALILSVWFNIRTLRRNESTNHTNWLVSLHQQFYTNNDYERVRNWIDYETLQFRSLLDHLKDVISGKKDLQPHPDIEIFHAYLNFLEFVCYLHHRKQIDDKEMEALFDWYLKDFAAKAKKHPEIRKYVEEFSFENLLLHI